MGPRSALSNCSFSFFYFLLLLSMAFFKKEENSRQLCQSLFTRGEGKGRRLPDSPAACVKAFDHEETLLWFPARNPGSRRARIYTFYNFSPGAPASAAPAPRAAICARGAARPRGGPGRGRGRGGAGPGPEAAAARPTRAHSADQQPGQTQPTLASRVRSASTPAAAAIIRGEPGPARA